MTDELLYVKLAVSAATSYSPLPAVHGLTVGTINQLYPLLIAPLYGSLDVPAAFHAAHLLNAPVMASAAIPAYLLARELVDRRAALAVAILSVVVVWMVLTGFLMTEVVAYPAFLWAVLAIQRAVSRESWRSDLVALAGIGLAVLARTQFLFLVAVLPLAIAGHELGFALTERGDLRAAVRTAYRRHRPLALLYGLALVAASLVAVFGSLSRVLGDYSVTATQGSLLPAGLLQSTAAHLDSVAIGCGLLPLLLGGGWLLTALARPPGRREHAFATIAVLTVILLTVESASFDIRFGGREIVRDRYVFYVVPLLLAGTAALLRGRLRPWIAPTALTILFAATVHWLPLPPATGLWVDSPTRVLNDLIADEAGSLSPGAFVAYTGLLLGICSVLALRLAPRRALGPAVFALLLAFSLFTTQRAIDHTVAGASTSGRGLAKPPGIVLDWVDTVLPHGATAGIVPFPSGPSFPATTVLWWDTEFWNRTVARAYVAGNGDFRYTPFPTERLLPDWSTGVFPGTDGAAQYTIMAESDPRFGLVADRVGTNFGLDILAPERPYRARWLSRGLQPDGWTTPGRTATIRVFPESGTPSEVSISLAAPTKSAARYALHAGARALHGTVAANATSTVQIRICGRTDLSLESPDSVRVPAVQRTFAPVGARRVGIHVVAVATQQAGNSC